jgi:hypothetical protein
MKRGSLGQITAIVIRVNTILQSPRVRDRYENTTGRRQQALDL